MEYSTLTKLINQYWRSSHNIKYKRKAWEDDKIAASVFIDALFNYKTTNTVVFFNRKLQLNTEIAYNSSDIPKECVNAYNLIYSKKDKDWVAEYALKSDYKNAVQVFDELIPFLMIDLSKDYGDVYAAKLYIPTLEDLKADDWYAIVTIT